MTVWVLFVMVYAGQKSSAFQYEFKDKAQCSNTFMNFKKHFKDTFMEVKGFCQEVRKF